ncbi:MAG: RNA polymerase sigma factor SigM [Kineosporiaceae bacterium]
MSSDAPTDAPAAHGVTGLAAPSGLPLAERDDKALMAAHVAGDPTAFTELVRRHRDRLWAVAARTMSDRQEAEDALQDALISAYRNAGSYRGDAAVTTWLHRVVVNACLDRIRRRQVRPTVAWGDREVASRRDDHAATEARLDVRAALALLPEGQRAAIVLVDMEELSVSEAAGMLGVAEGTVKSRCSRGRAALAVLLRGASTPGDPGGRPGNQGGGPRVAPATPTAAAGHDADPPGDAATRRTGTRPTEGGGAA